VDQLPEISVVIPAYNEAARLPVYLESVVTYLDRTHGSYEIVVVDDGSADDTSGVVRRLSKGNSRVRLFRLPENRGKGFAVKTGMLAATGKLRLFADADGATPIEEVERLKSRIAGGVDVAVASRAREDGDCAVNAKLHRKIVGGAFNVIVQTLTVRGIRDTQCGFKLFTAEAAAKAFQLQKIHGFGFDVEVLFINAKYGFRIAEVPVNWSDVGGSKVRLVRDSVRMFRDVLTVRYNDLTSKY
jgi:dolichyl-phosphate beta-glucosyltransferase